MDANQGAVRCLHHQRCHLSPLRRSTHYRRLAQIEREYPGDVAERSRLDRLCLRRRSRSPGNLPGVGTSKRPQEVHKELDQCLRHLSHPHIRHLFLSFIRRLLRYILHLIALFLSNMWSRRKEGCRCKVINGLCYTGQFVFSFFSIGNSR